MKKKRMITTGRAIAILIMEFVLGVGILEGQEARDTAKSGIVPLSRIMGQPERIVDKILGNPDKRRRLGSGEDYPGGTYVSYPDSQSWTVLFVMFYHDQLAHLEFCFKSNPASEKEFFAALGLSRVDFKVIDRRPPPLPAIGYSGVINKKPILIVAREPTDGTGGFCECPSVEVTTPEGRALDGTPLH
jgi:hypothetical protein